MGKELEKEKIMGWDKNSSMSVGKINDAKAFTHHLPAAEWWPASVWARATLELIKT